MKTSLYNQDGSLCTEAQLFFSLKPDNVSTSEWRKRIKEFKLKLSAEDLIEFKKLIKKKSYLKHKEKRLQQTKKYYQKNKKAITKQHEAYYQANKKEQLSRCRSWAKSNRERINEIAADWRKSNPEKTKQSQENWHAKNPNKRKEYRKKQMSKPTWKLRMAVSTTFKRISQKKPAKTEELLGCSCEEAIKYIESLFTEGMSWDNYGEWHIDHIRPVSSFVENELHLMNKIENLQPLWAEDNLKKGNTYKLM